MRRLLSIALFASLTSCSSHYMDNAVAIVAPSSHEVRLSDEAPSSSPLSHALPTSNIPSASIESVEVETGFPDQRMFITSLTANQEVNIDPSRFDTEANSKASAVGILVVDTMTHSVSGNVTFENIDKEDFVTDVAIHASAAGSNGPRIIELTQSKNDPHVFDIQNDTSMLDLIDKPGGNLSTLLSAGWYFNLKTKLNPDGQLRGQITPNNIDVIRVELETEQHIPTVTRKSSPSASAVGYFTFSNVDDSVLPIANVLVRGFEATQVNLHCGGFIGHSGEFKAPLKDISPRGFPGTVFTSNNTPIANLTALKKGAYYFNAHSALNPDGEVRGQITTDELQAIPVQSQTDSKALVAANRQVIEQ